MAEVRDAFRQRHIFVTGGTGFVGKVLIYKLLKEFSDIGGIYVLIRRKKNTTPSDRLQKELLSSACFDPLRASLGAEEWKRRASLVKAIGGDIVIDGLGIEPSEYTMLTERLTGIMHLAATVDFQEKLNASVDMNVLGALRVVALAHKCKRLEHLIHVSTCYVNWNRHGTVVREVIYPLPFDAEGMCKHILSLAQPQVASVSKRLLEKYQFPNTYTFTKSMGEQLVERNKGTLPLSIVRPSIVGCSLKEPVPGWVDALTAAGGIFLTAGLGVLQELNAKINFVADIVPVDYVVNTMIKVAYKTQIHYHRDRIAAAPSTAAALAQQAAGAAVIHSQPAAALEAAKGSGLPATTTASPAVVASSSSSVAAAAESGSTGGDTPATGVMPFIYQSATSGTMNPMTWHMMRLAIVTYWNGNPHPKRLAKASPWLISSTLQYNLVFFFRRQVPLMGMKVLSSLPVIGTEEQRKQIQRYEKALNRSVDLNFQFWPFTNYEWRFDSSNSGRFLEDGLSAEAAQMLSTDPFEINWHSYAELYSYGMIKYIMKSDDGRGPPTVPLSGSQKFLRASL